MQKITKTGFFVRFLNKINYIIFNFDGALKLLEDSPTAGTIAKIIWKP